MLVHLSVQEAMASAEALDLIEHSLNAAPENERFGLSEVLLGMYNSRMLAFTFPPGGIVIIGRNRARLNIIAFNGWQSAFALREVAADLKKIAAEWGCDTIETTVYDPRLARAIQRIGGAVESTNLTLAVE